MSKDTVYVAVNAVASDESGQARRHVFVDNVQSCLGASAKLPKRTIASSCLPAHMQQLGFH